MIKKLRILLCIAILAFLVCGCDGNENSVDSKPIMCDTINATAKNFNITMKQAYGTSKPEVKDGKDATPFVIYLTYTGKEGVSYILGDASAETDKYIRFRLLHANEYYFEEYVICEEDDYYKDSLLSINAYAIHSGEILKDLPFLHFEPMDESSKLYLWMIVPEEVMHSDESLYFIINVDGQEFWYDITDAELDFYEEW